MAEASQLSDDTQASEVAAADEATAAASYQSVVYVHGMGSQRRYEETSRLIDRLDQYLVRRRDRGSSLGILCNIKVRVEPLRGSDSLRDTVRYIRTVYTGAPGAESPQTVRFYEVYWAPIMAEQKSAWGVLKWIVRQAVRPWHTLRSPWRERQRLRRATLVSLAERSKSADPEFNDRDTATLIGLYDEFEGLSAQRNFERGSFEEFLAFIGRETEARPDTTGRLQALAKRWIATYRREELRNAFILTTMALALALSAGGVLYGIAKLLEWIPGLLLVSGVLEQADTTLNADWATVSATAIALAGLFGITGFLTKYMGDVEAWATYEETDSKHKARKKVLDRSMDVLTHVLGDPDCERVTVVSHSLGTSVAHDALLALSHRNLARNVQDPISGPIPLNKIEHFVTIGSPIDKIEYFFESYASASHRYKRVTEALRGDIGTVPFTRNRHPHIHWVNFWDQGDAISGALHSPANRKVFAQRVDNVHVASFHFPDTGASHAGYFDNATVISNLFEMIYRRAGSFHTLKRPGPKQPYDYNSVYFGPGEPLGYRWIFLLMAGGFPWAVALGLIAWLAELPTIAYGAWTVAALLLVTLVVGLAGSKAMGQRNPL